MPAQISERIRAVMNQYWGFDALRPLQGESIAATIAGHDSLTVMPTGGGKSLCFQVPPLVTGRLTLVVSPLIALMQDQVAGLKLAGVPAAAMFGAMGPAAHASVCDEVTSGRCALLFVSPERLFAPGGGVQAMLVRAGLGHIAVDEAHCISQWGHDFRPEYRRLRELRRTFPGVPVGAYTATATPRVRADIVDQLDLRDPVELVGNFDRPNLTYRILPRMDEVQQTFDAIARHGSDNAAIVYCISRRDTESLASALKKKGINAAPYHAGMTPTARTKTSEDFKTERLSVVVATVAFGMGIDRGDVRTVVHAAMPKSVEAYQQETGRAGRDGLPAECLLLYSNADVVKWRGLIERSAADAEVPVAPDVLAAQRQLLDQMQNIASGGRCRHRALCEYFGQKYAPVGGASDCGACDVCLNELEEVAGGHEIARKIISCVYRIEQHGGRFGTRHLVDVLRGSHAQGVTGRNHHTLSTFGILSSISADRLNAFVNQLVDAGALARSTDQYPTVHLGGRAGALLRNTETARLVEPKAVLAAEGRGARRKAVASSSAGRQLTPLEVELFDQLRALRRTMAQERSIPPFLIASDAVLEELCRVRPAAIEGLTSVRGIGRQKAQDLGERFTALISSFCRDKGLPTGQLPSRDSATDDRHPQRLTPGASAAAVLFGQGASIQDVMDRCSKARSTVVGYLCDFLADHAVVAIDPWVPQAAQQRIIAIAQHERTASVGIIRQRLLDQGEDPENGIDYDQIRITLAHRRAKR